MQYGCVSGVGKSLARNRTWIRVEEKFPPISIKCRVPLPKGSLFMKKGVFPGKGQTEVDASSVAMKD